MKKVNIILIAFILTIPSISFAHSGRTDASGCHTCRTNCASWGLSTGEYHCHRSKGVTQPIEPIRSIRNEGGTGKTVPAPEYKVPVVNTIKTPANIAPTVKVTPKPIVEPTSEIKPIIEQVVEQSQKQDIIIPTTTTKTEKPITIKRFFNWLFK